MTTFVTMYHPALNNVRVQAPVEAEALYEAHGWVLDGGTAPPPADIYLTPALGDVRYAPIGSGGGGALTDAAMASALGSSTATAMAARAELKAAIDAEALPRWKASTSYASGDLVLNPSGQIVQANSSFTSGSSYSATNWTIVAGGTGGGGGGVTATVDGTSASSLTVTSATASDIAALVDTRYVKLASNLSDLPSPSTARTNLGLGSAATQAAGSASGVATLDGSGNVPLAQLGNVGSTAYNAAVDPSLHNLNTWSFDPISASGSTVAGTGVTQYVRLRASKTATVSTAYLYATSAGSGLTAGIVSLLDSAGNNLGSTADQATAWSSTGLKAMTFGTPISLTAGQVYYLAFLPVGTTGPGVARGPFATTAVNAAIGTAPFRFGNSGSGQTSIGATVVLTSTSASTNAWWVALG